MPMPNAGQVGSMADIPRGDRLVQRDVDTADAALVSDGVTVAKPYAEAVEVNVVEMPFADLPRDVWFRLRSPHGQVEMMLVAGVRLIRA